MLPEWMKDNEHLHKGHRPELQSAAECFKSIFRIHTETGNIWTHMIGFFAFLVVTIVFYVKPFCDNCRYAAKTSNSVILKGSCWEEYIRETFANDFYLPSRQINDILHIWPPYN